MEGYEDLANLRIVDECFCCSASRYLFRTILVFYPEKGSKLTEGGGLARLLNSFYASCLQEVIPQVLSCVDWQYYNVW